MDHLTWLSNWFASQCDGEWETDYGLTLETVNNPGWALGVDLDGTGINPGGFKPVALQRTEHDWIEAKIIDGVFHGGASPQNLNELVGIFRAYVEGTATSTRSSRPRADHRPKPTGHRGGKPRNGPPRGRGDRS